MIKVRDLYKSFDGNKVLKGVNFSIETGEAVAIIGKSGSGKSVLLKHINGLLKPDSGEIWVDNKLVNTLSFRKLQNIRAKMGMVFQAGALFDSLTVGENIGLALRRLTKLRENEVLERVQSSLIDVDLQGTENLMPAELSGGMKKRVGIARAIAIKPDFLLYDEPTTGLDPVMTDIINRLIVKFQKINSITSIIVTHEMRTVFDVSNRIIMLHNGKVQFDGTSEEIKNCNDLAVRQFITGDSSLVC
ncbi:MAG: ATP-binding cassette domain-containing protein [Candidatus Marinimicrobia bacterium]|nr:ATP-binding cassette domain-containing protein [Candidatus Neomarinimicrobiota bacterium]MBL7022640.1 ATP-binding cassette domain-containing protein [Candidatus Neomarinimicrobiota bacterium]